MLKAKSIVASGGADYLRIAEAAELLNVSMRTFYYLRELPGFPRPFQWRRVVRYEKRKLVEWVENYQNEREVK